MSITATPMKPVRPSIVSESAPEVTAEFDIRPSRGWIAIDFKELLHYRELLYFLTWRDVKVRYKQTTLGFAWAIIQPLMSVLIFTVIFGKLAGFDSKVPDELKARHIPYSLFSYAGVLPWMLFAVGVGAGGNSLVSQQNLLTKVYFPRLFVPASIIGAALVDTLISLGVFCLLMVGYRLAPHSQIVLPSWQLLALPFLLLLTCLAGMGMAFTFSSLTVSYRDFRFLIPFMVSTWQYVSPVGYPIHSINHPWVNWLLPLNPMYGIINGFRSALLGQHWEIGALLMSVVEVAAILTFGMYFFKRTERRFADIA